MINIDILLSRLDQLEAKVVKVDQLEAKVDSLQIEVNQLKKKNSKLEEQSQLVLAAAEKLSIVASILFRDKSHQSQCPIWRVFHRSRWSDRWRFAYSSLLWYDYT